ncbi:MAG: hypothetical protein GTN99_02890 [Candidatus Dadabacteria bacterium]|nr:hypothetical protein [Candidatus Dadabacteria bacterium]
MKLTLIEKVKLAGLGITAAILMWIIIYSVGTALMNYARYSGFMSACVMFHTERECKKEWRTENN